MMGKKFLLILMSVLGLSFCEGMSVNAAAAEDTSELVTVADVSNFIPIAANETTPEEDRKSILIIGAHPDQERWQKWWPQLAEKYNLTFIHYDPNFDPRSVKFESSAGVIIEYNDALRNNIARSSDRHIRVWDLDFNSKTFATKINNLYRRGEQFDLIINDYCVYNFFETDMSKRIAAFASLLKPKGYCVLGPMSYRGNQTLPLMKKEIYFDEFDSSPFRVLKQIFSWNIGGTNEDKRLFEKSIQDLRSKYKDNAARKQIELLEETMPQLWRGITKEKATNAVNKQLKDNFSTIFSARGGQVKINPIQTVKFSDIKGQLDRILPEALEGWLITEPPIMTMWMIISPNLFAPYAAANEWTASEYNYFQVLLRIAAQSPTYSHLRDRAQELLRLLNLRMLLTDKDRANLQHIEENMSQPFIGESPFHEYVWNNIKQRMLQKQFPDYWTESLIDEAVEQYSADIKSPKISEKKTKERKKQKRH